MKEVKKIYQDAYAKHGNSIKSILIPKGRQNERFDSLAMYIKDAEVSVLDFGCGLGHLNHYLASKFSNIHYTGTDIVDEFIQENTKNYPKSTFYKISSYKDVTENYDYIIAAGVFNIKYDPDTATHKTIVYDHLKHLLDKTNKVLSVNFMTDQVDFIQEGAYHQNVTELYEYAIQNLSKRVVIDQSYMPYEFTIHIFKDQEIVRPDNIYKSI